MRSAAILLLLLVSAGAVSATDPVMQFINQLVQDIAEKEKLDQPVTRRLLTQWTPGQSFQDFMHGLMGRDWADYVPPAWQNHTFDWSHLGTFSYGSNLKDFINSVDWQNITKPESAYELHQWFQNVSSYFCTEESFSAGQMVDASCTGPQVTLAYVPKVCILNEQDSEVICDPAKIVISKTPGSCTHKYKSAASWTGKECKITGGAGFSKTTTYGGGSYSIPLAEVSISLQP